MGQLLDTGGEGYLCVGGRGVMGGLKFSHNCIRVHPPSGPAVRYRWGGLFVCGGERSDGWSKIFT